MSGRFSEINLFNAAGEKQTLRLVFTLGALAAIETALGRPMTQTFQDITVEGIAIQIFY